jgi:hypothetical protein
MLISTTLLLDSNIRNSVCTPAKLPCRRVEVGYDTERKKVNISFLNHHGFENYKSPRKKKTRFETPVNYKEHEKTQNCFITINIKNIPLIS